MENTLNFFKSIELRTTPIIANPQTIANIVHPNTRSYCKKVTKQNGVYVPAIIAYIAQWSSTCKTFFPVLGLNP